VAAHLHASDGDGDLISALEDVKHVSADALHQLRTTLQSLRDSDGSALTVTTQPARLALEDLMKPLDLAGLRVEFACDPAADQAPAQVRHAGLRIVQESLTNVLRHAHARSVSVSLAVADGQLSVDITNDGPVAPPHTIGHGLTGMRERAHEVGGTIFVGSLGLGGWRVHAVLPMSSPTS
jgi:signal transduction histidine kinase